MDYFRVGYRGILPWSVRAILITLIGEKEGSVKH